MNFNVYTISVFDKQAKNKIFFLHLLTRYKGANMIAEYIANVIKSAKYEILSEDNSIYAEIPGFQGVYANAETFEECRSELIEVLEEWLIFRLRKNLDLPIIHGIDLQVRADIDATV